MEKGVADRGVRMPQSGADDRRPVADRQSGDEGIDDRPPEPPEDKAQEQRDPPRGNRQSAHRFAQGGRGDQVNDDY